MSNNQCQAKSFSPLLPLPGSLDEVQSSNPFYSVTDHTKWSFARKAHRWIIAAGSGLMEAIMIEQQLRELM